MPTPDSPSSPPFPGLSQQVYIDTSVTINVDVRGSGPAVVLLHGFGASRESWNDIEPYLAPHFTLYKVDLKGFGFSSKPTTGDYSILEQGSLVVALLDHFQLRDVTVVGHSYGGAVALAAYFILKDRGTAHVVQRIALIDAPAYLQRLPFFVRLLRWPILNHLILTLSPARWRARFVLHRLFWNADAVTSERIERYARYFDLPQAHAAYIRAARHVLRRDGAVLSPRVKTISIPTLILWGAQDRVIPPRSADRLHQDISSSRLHVIPDCGHVPHEEIPGAAAELLLGFLRDE